MTICFIHSQSRLKGPYDVLDATHRRCIKKGDICLKESDKGTSALLVHSDNNRWSACKPIGSCPQRTGWKGNSILFSFDGRTKRQGKQKELELLMQLFQNTPVCQLLSNAVSILNYEVDYWELSCLSQLYAIPYPPSETLTMNEPPTNAVSRTIPLEAKLKRKPLLFQHYLNAESNQLLEELEAEGIRLHEIYKRIRATYPSAYRQAILQFIRENPSRTIYDISNEPH